MESNWIERLKLGALFMSTLIAVLSFVSRADIKAIVSNGWTWFYLGWLCFVVYYIIDRYLRIKSSFQRLNTDIISKRNELKAIIPAHERTLTVAALEQTRNFREMIYYAVLDQAGAIIKNEVLRCKGADAALDQRLKAIEDRLPPVGVT